jgi:hypothetical protein
VNDFKIIESSVAGPTITLDASIGFAAILPREIAIYASSIHDQLQNNLREHI